MAVAPGGWRRGLKAIQHPELVARCRVETPRWLLTAHVSAGRFCSGYVLETFENSAFTAILSRLQHLLNRRQQHARPWLPTASDGQPSREAPV